MAAWSLYRLTRWRRRRWRSLRAVRTAHDLASLTEAVCAFSITPHDTPTEKGLHAFNDLRQQALQALRSQAPWGGL
jgi:hypothetical protein